MNILITGSMGVIGSALSAELRERGHYVVGCDLYHTTDEEMWGRKRATYARCDVGSFRQLERVFNVRGPFGLVYHCAAEFGRWNGEDYYEQMWRTNTIGTKHLIRLQESLGFKMVYFSSSEVYGNWEGAMTEPVMDQYPIQQMNDYAISKWAGEIQVRNSACQYGTQTVIVRLFNTYGPGEYYSPYRSANCRFLYSALHNIPWIVYGGHHRTSTYLSDAVWTVANIADCFHPGEVYNIGGGELHSIEVLSDVVLSVTGANESLVRHETSEILTTTSKQPDISKAERDLGHKNTVCLKEGMARTAEWMRKVYNVQEGKSQ
jgi:dTDP-glucose 4,6-dehydratase